MRTLTLLAVVLVICEISYGLPRSAPDFGGRTRQYLRNRKVGSKIVGGQPADIANFPHMLVLLDLTAGGFICGASVIHERWSLSAAHCLEFNVPANLINLRGGSTNRLTGGFIFVAESYTLHPQYDPNWLDFDIAIIRTIADSVMTGPNVVPVPISPSCATSCCQACDPEPVTITGWGRNEFGQFPVDLQQITLPIYNLNECDSRWGGIPDVFFCVWAGNGQDSCNGDSGSPLVRNVGAQRFQIGLVSFGSANCGDGSFPSVNTRIEHPGVRGWINSVSGL